MTTALLWRLFGQPAVMAVPLAVALDYAGFLAWTVNTYRVLTFVLFFGLALAVDRRRPLWFGVLTFALFQVEYAMALFLGVATCMLALLLYGWRAWRLIGASAIGAPLSLTVFAVQVLTYYGWDGLMAEIAHTYARRGPEGAAGGPDRYAFQAWHGLLLLLDTMVLESYNRAVVVVVVAGLTIEVVKLARGRYDGQRRVLASLLVSTTLGAMATSALLYGYFVDTYVVSLLPCGVFLAALATGVVAIEISDVMARLSGLEALASYASLTALLPIVVASATVYRPPIAVEYVSLLQTEYRDRTIVGPTVGQWLFAPELAFSLTGGRAAQTAGIEATPEDVQRLADLRAADGTLTYACLDTLYIRKAARRGDPSVCEVAEARMVQRGHEVVADGFGWTVMRLFPEDRPTTAASCRPTGRSASRRRRRPRPRAASPPSGRWAWSRSGITRGRRGTFQRSEACASRPERGRRSEGSRGQYRPRPGDRAGHQRREPAPGGSRAGSAVERGPAGGIGLAAPDRGAGGRGAVRGVGIPAGGAAGRRSGRLRRANLGAARRRAVRRRHARRCAWRLAGPRPVDRRATRAGLHLRVLRPGREAQPCARA